ncbi:MAG: SMEK domain-containing protein [Saprospiraceae bacterium]|nr:SMEK domain-containing protein [Saprospiraceae bacterium]MBK7795899.1 SMEK domain-containing protein [Saprospiraceae bacterium]MBL0261011.1 SMEK domain-containing protein [Saprospiraceae bacterium]
MNSILLDNQIINALTLLEFRVIKANNLGYYDINRKIQGYLGKIIDVVYFEGRQETIELDKIQANYPAIDLANYNKKTVYQITSETNTDKIYETLSKFTKLEEFETGKLGEIRFLILNKISYTPKVLKNIADKFNEKGLLFSNSTLMTIPMLENEISKLSNIKKELLVSLLNEELQNPDKNLQFATLKDIEDLKDLYGKYRFKDIGRIEDANDERHSQKLAEILGIDVEELEMLDYDIQFIDNDNGVNSTIYVFKPDDDTAGIITRIDGINDNKIEIFDWEWYDEEENK